MGKTGYYCLLASMELLLSLRLNKRSKARAFADHSVQTDDLLRNKSSPLWLVTHSRLKRLSVCVSGDLYAFVCVKTLLH